MRADPRLPSRQERGGRSWTLEPRPANSRHAFGSSAFWLRKWKRSGVCSNILWQLGPHVPEPHCCPPEQEMPAKQLIVMPSALPLPHFAACPVKFARPCASENTTSACAMPEKKEIVVILAVGLIRWASADADVAAVKNAAANAKISSRPSAFDMKLRNIGASHRSSAALHVPLNCAKLHYGFGLRIDLRQQPLRASITWRILKAHEQRAEAARLGRRFSKSGGTQNVQVHASTRAAVGERAVDCHRWY